MCADVPAREPRGPGPGTSGGFQMSAVRVMSSDCGAEPARRRRLVRATAMKNAAGTPLLSAAGRSAAGVRQVAHHGHAHLEAVAVVVRQAATDTRKRAVVQIKPIRAERRI